MTKVWFITGSSRGLGKSLGLYRLGEKEILPCEFDEINFFYSYCAPEIQ
jgi:hypothetical protein